MSACCWAGLADAHQFATSVAAAWEETRSASVLGRTCSGTSWGSVPVGTSLPAVRTLLRASSARAHAACSGVDHAGATTEVEECAGTVNASATESIAEVERIAVTSNSKSGYPLRPAGPKSSPSATLGTA